MGIKFNAAAAAGDDAPASDQPIDNPDGDGAVVNPVETLYRHHRSRLLRFFTRRTDANDAQDLVQDAFARYVGCADDDARQIVSPEAYLSQVSVNLLRDRAKFAARRAAGYHQVFEDEHVAGTDPVAGLEARDRLRRLEAAVQRLKPRSRRVFLLQRAEGMSYAEIADITGMSIKAVKKTMAKALFDLRREFGSL